LGGTIWNGQHQEKRIKLGISKFWESAVTGDSMYRFVQEKQLEIIDIILQAINDREYVL